MTMTERSSQPCDPSSLTQLFQMIAGFRETQAIYVAAKLGIADLIAQTPKTAAELAQAINDELVQASKTKAHAPSLRRLLLMLSSLGIFAEDTDGKFRSTPLGDLLRRDHPQSQQSLAILFGSAFFWKPWGELYETIVSGQPAFDRMYAMPFFDYLSTHPEDAAIFNGAMTSITAQVIPAVLAAYDFSRFERIVDVGGGHGAVLQAILSANPGLHGVLADLPAVVAGATALKSEPIARRCSTVGTNFFESVPDGADCYLMKRIIHDWNDEDAVKILRNCRRAIRPGGTLLLIEWVLKGLNQPDPGRASDLLMLAMLGGQERTEADFATLLGKAGFSLTQVIATSGPASIVESHPN
jgi:SAM-dependent methyltransferase